MSDVNSRIEKASRTFGPLREPIFNNPNMSVATKCVCVCGCVGGCVGVWVCGCVGVTRLTLPHTSTQTTQTARYTDTDTHTKCHVYEQTQPVPT